MEWRTLRLANNDQAADGLEEEGTLGKIMQVGWGGGK